MLLSSRNPLATKWYMLVIQGIVFFFLYYFIFYFIITRFNLKTPGREEADPSEEESESSKASTNDELAEKMLPLLGGADNLVTVDNCITRLRLDVKDSSLVNDAEIKKLGVAGVLKPSKTSVQIIVGTQVEFVANALKRMTGK